MRKNPGLKSETWATHSFSLTLNLLTLKMKRSGLCSFVLQKPALSFHTAAVAGEGTVGSDDAMTRYNDADWIGTIG